ncbi:hypothetical protein V6N13_011818 [Hibiscus sabdariffa]|uniref:Uncharacterized protein n=1 Tax=Hibiscus sabdariffa TaxID=183260 RepID=A0ABR2SDI3_9ROSI
MLAQTLLKQDCAVTALAINTKGSVLYSGSSDGVVNFWEVEKQLAHGGVLNGHKQAILCLAATEYLVFSGSADKTICAWRKDGNIHTSLCVLTGHMGPVKCLAVEKDHESRSEQRWIVYSGSLDNSVKVWSVAEYAQVTTGHQNQQQANFDFATDYNSCESEERPLFQPA